MSWDIKKKFAALRNAKTSRKNKRNRTKKFLHKTLWKTQTNYSNIIDDSSDEENTIKNSRNKSNCSINDELSEGEIVYDPDYDNYKIDDTPRLKVRNKSLDLYNISKINNSTTLQESNSRKGLNQTWESSFKESNIIEIDSENSKDSQQNEINIIVDDDLEETPNPNLKRKNDNEELDALINDVQKDLRKKKRKYKSGGLNDRLQKVLSNFESERSFWSHEINSKLIDSQFIGKISKIQNSFGRCIVYLNVNHEEIAFIVDPDDRYMNKLKIGANIKIDLSANIYEIDGTKIFLARNKFHKI